MTQTVRTGVAGDTAGAIVVGYDGSRNALAALGWAVEDARRRARPLLVVRAWTISSALSSVPAPYGTVPSVKELADALTDSTERDLATVDASGVEVELRVVHGPAAQTLVAISAGAELLVVGTRGGGGFASLLIGSTADQVVHHAACTVVIVRSPPG